MAGVAKHNAVFINRDFANSSNIAKKLQNSFGSPPIKPVGINVPDRFTKLAVLVERIAFPFVEQCDLVTPID